MNKKQLIIVWVVISIILSGCSPAYRFVKIDKTTGGYMVKKGRIDMPYFTINELKQYPQELKLAKKRFKNRRSLLEKYYKDKYLEVFQSPFMSGIKFLGFYIFIPVSGLLMDYFQNRPSEEIGEEEIKQFIEEDCKKEQELK